MLKFTFHIIEDKDLIFVVYDKLCHCECIVIKDRYADGYAKSMGTDYVKEEMMRYSLSRLNEKCYSVHTKEEAIEEAKSLLIRGKYKGVE